MNFEETKSKYEEEIKRLNVLAQITHDKYQKAYDDLKAQEQNLVKEFNDEIQKITIGIERLRGAYTALCDMQEGKDPTLVVNGMMQDVEVPQEAPAEETPTVEEAIIDDSVAIGKEPVEEVNEISEEVKEKAKSLVKEAKEKGLVTPYAEFAESELGKETALTEAELEALSKVTNAEVDKTEENTPKENTPREQVVNAADVPDYLKDQYGIK